MEQASQARLLRELWRDGNRSYVLEELRSFTPPYRAAVAARLAVIIGDDEVDTLLSTLDREL